MAWRSTGNSNPQSGNARRWTATGSFIGARLGDKSFERAQKQQQWKIALRPLLQDLTDWSRFDARTRVQNALAVADIRLNGTRPWDLIVKDSRFYTRLLRTRSIGLGDSYMDNWWECADLEGCLWRILQSRVKSRR